MGVDSRSHDDAASDQPDLRRDLDDVPPPGPGGEPTARPVHRATGAWLVVVIGVAAFVMLIVAMLLWSLACRGDGRWWSFCWTPVTLAVTAAVAAAWTQLAGGASWSGAVQRMLASAVPAWFVLTAFHVRNKAFSAP